MALRDSTDDNECYAIFTALHDLACLKTLGENSANQVMQYLLERPDSNPMCCTVLCDCIGAVMKHAACPGHEGSRKTYLERAVNILIDIACDMTYGTGCGKWNSYVLLLRENGR